MEFNKDILQGKWNEFKGQVKKTWGKLTDDEIEQAKGNLEELGGIIQQHYGEAKEESKRKLDEIVSRFKAQGENKPDSPQH